MDTKKKEVLDLFNRLLEIKNIDYVDFNRVVKFNEQELEKLLELEKNDDRLGVHTDNKLPDGVSVLTLIATITDVLVGDRLAFVINEGKLTGVTWNREKL